MKTGILGGTFNPIHNAHLRIAEEVLQSCNLDRILFIPTAAPPHKDVAGEVSFQHRLAMVKAAIDSIPEFQPSDLENRRDGKSFTVDTLEVLRREDPPGELFFIIGMDSYRDISSWKEFRRIFGLAHMVITTRPGVTLNSPFDPLPIEMHKDFCYDKEAASMRHKSGNRLFFLQDTCLDISSTQIRELLTTGQSIDHLTPAVVIDYIRSHKLYSAEKTRRSH